MLGEELGNLGFHSLGQKGARPATQDFGELVGEHPWLNELDDGIFGHGVSSFGGEVAGLITATIRRLHSFTPSPTSAHSSKGSLADYPDLVAEWIADKNMPLVPEKVAPGSSRKAWWRCPKG